MSRFFFLGSVTFSTHVLSTRRRFASAPKNIFSRENSFGGGGGGGERRRKLDCGEAGVVFIDVAACYSKWVKNQFAVN